jgi:hypothetical protein
MVMAFLDFGYDGTECPDQEDDWSRNFVESEKTIVRACYSGTGQQKDVPRGGFKFGLEMLAGFDILL